MIARVGAVSHQPDSGGKSRGAYTFDQSIASRSAIAGHADANLRLKDAFGERNDRVEQCRSAGENDSRAEHLVESALHDLMTSQGKQLLDARFDDLCQQLPRNQAAVAAGHAGDLDGLIASHGSRQGAAAAELEYFGLAEVGLQAGGNVVGHVIAAERQDRRVLEGTLRKDKQIGRTRTQVDQRYAEWLMARHGGDVKAAAQEAGVDVAVFRALAAGTTPSTTKFVLFSRLTNGDGDGTTAPFDVSGQGTWQFWVGPNGGGRPGLSRPSLTAAGRVIPVSSRHRRCR